MNYLLSWSNKIMIALFIGVLFVFLYTYFQGYDSSISWNVTTSAESEELSMFSFKKGPFLFSFDGEKFSLAEVFSAGPIERHYSIDALFLCITLLGICLMLTAFSFFSRYWFIGSMALFIFFLISLHLPAINLFGFDSHSSGSMIVMFIAYVVPAYLFNAYFPNLNLIWRLLSFILVTTGIVFFSDIEIITLQEQFISGSYLSLVALSLLFLLLIAEEIIFAILFLITQSKGGKNNHIHFIVFSIAYLVIIGLHYAKKAGYAGIGVDFFDPYILFVISICVAFWTLKFKTDYFPKFQLQYLRLLFTGIAVVVLTFLGFALYRGNDPVFEGLHYFIVYAHLGFGSFFLFYVIINFITPLINGQQVYKILFEEQSFPFVSAKLGGMAAVTAFFFLAQKTPLFLLQAGHFNYMGAQEETNGNALLANEYYLEGSIYGHDNHFSNYKLGYYALQNNKIDEAVYRFGRSTLRHPSPQSFVNHSGALAIKGESTPALITLKEGLRVFPENDYLQNNLGLMYVDLDNEQEATKFLSNATFTGNWTNAGLVNLWKISHLDPQKAEEDFNKGNLAVKANIIQNLLKEELDLNIAFDSSSLYPSFSLHRQAYLINASWYFQDETVPKELLKSLVGAIDEQIYQAAKFAAAMGYYHTGNINQAMSSLDALRLQANNKNKARYAQALGLIALSQHSPKLALKFFNEAIQYGSVPAVLNKQACLMELQKYDEALEWTQNLIAIDTEYSTIVRDFTLFQQRENLSQDQQIKRLYYYYPEYSIAEVAALLEYADYDFIESFWVKVSKELLHQKNFNLLKDYYDVFATYLLPPNFVEYHLMISLSEGKEIHSNHPLTQVLQQTNPQQKLVALKELANQNALNEPLLLTIVNELKTLDETTAYEVLVEATRINSTSVSLLKNYIVSALNLGLKAYAENALTNLESMTDTEDFDLFKALTNDKQKELDNSKW